MARTFTQESDLAVGMRFVTDKGSVVELTEVFPDRKIAAADQFSPGGAKLPVIYYFAEIGRMRPLGWDVQWAYPATPPVHTDWFSFMWFADRSEAEKFIGEEMADSPRTKALWRVIEWPMPTPETDGGF